MTQRFTDKKTLTKMVGMDGWIIYRDSLHGIYARNEEMGLDFPIDCRWNITLNSPHLQADIEYIRECIRREENPDTREY